MRLERFADAEGVGSLSRSPVSRRSLLKAGAVAGGGLLLGFSLPPSMRGAVAAGAAADSFAPNAFVRIDRDGKVTLIMPYVEMGQGTYTSIPMLIAEELDIDFAKVTVENIPPTFTVDAEGRPQEANFATGAGGSTAVWESYDKARQAGAAARHMLLSAAARQWGVPMMRCWARGFSGSASAGNGSFAASATRLP